MSNALLLDSETSAVAIVLLTGTPGTKFVQDVECNVGGHKVLMVDTPGLDDTTLEDGDILERIAKWLKQSYDENMRLSGLIYMHDIQEARVGRSSLKNMTLFRLLTGQESMRNVVLLTTKWDALGPDQERGYAREVELQAEPGFWKVMMVDGARVMRHDGTHASAERIVLSLLGEDQTVVRIQEQMSDGRPLIQTEAGQYINHEQLEFQKQHQEEMKALREEIEMAARSGKYSMLGICASLITSCKEKVELTRELQADYNRKLNEVQASQAQQQKLLEQRVQNAETKVEEEKQKLWEIEGRHQELESRHEKQRKSDRRAHSRLKEDLRREKRKREE